MEKELKVHEKAQIVFTKDGKTNIVDGEVSGKNKKSFLVKCFKRVVWSLDKSKYDLVEVTSATIKILRKNIQNIIPLKHDFNVAIEGTDDYEY